MLRFILAAALLCAAALPARAQKIGGDVGDPYACFGAGRYQAMREGRICPPRPTETCVASWYGRESGPRTANGERFNPDGMTCAHRSAPFGTILHVRRLDTGRAISCRVNDRGPFVRGRCVDLAQGAARALGVTGIAKVRVD